MPPLYWHVYVQTCIMTFIGPRLQTLKADATGGHHISGTLLVADSHRDMLMQYWQPKATTTQTPTERGQSMPRKVQQIKGLPHSKECAVVSTFEIDIGQPYEL